ncbi:aminotransferase class I/II-fold pyridoxal phosphate-dependent enzyme [Pseudonocardia sp. DSM 110487]|uniref:aminotransferase class I/II-fold pyridoxal phosphate-dependent enzyme n=1 Tax=Pseudonocardia sp. DSM 110487 TaxID=2865833 RepID=UPI001C69DD80|nr:aminotransferase class I/II-fold pyridoxal phosphate-dependent enzyme [Pseudonocardia sp. DSM 110487]QYN39975.1 aminotransferase class I/II-fold pyridoxal phosphate-dependent enzyme [Pseudonocardia sp. DSM 110487]
MQPVPPAQLTVAARAAVPPFHVMDVWAAAAERQRAHGDLVNLSAGQPSTPAPAAVRAAAAAALDGDVLGYTVALGIPELREAIAAHYARTYALDVPPEQVVLTTGSSGGFLLAFLAAFDVGDRVALARPGYPCYRNILTTLGCEVVDLPCGPQTRYQPTVAMLEALDEPVRGLVVASPANPTGTVLDAAELAALAEYCEQTGVQLISDEIYHGISYPGAPATSSAWATSREAIVVNSFSKYFSMTGWRLGWLLLPPRLLRAADCLTGNFTICPPALAQRAALGAFEESSYAEAGGHVARYSANRALLLDGLAGLGITRLAPADGAFYVYADVSHLTLDSMAFTHRLLAETGVAVAPGVDFDPVDGGRFIRLSFAGATEDITETLERLAGWLPKG